MQPDNRREAGGEPSGAVFLGKLLGGPALFLAMLLLPAPEGLGPEGQRTAALAVWMSWWWITGAIPVGATALLPFALFPFLGVMSSAEAIRNFAHWMNFLILGGFFIAAAMEKWNLHKRFALAIVEGIGVTPRRIVLGFMVGTALMSMWINNTATACMMLPVAMAALAKVSEAAGRDAAERLSTPLMLSIAYAASIGGVGTLIGTAPNGVFAAMTQEMYGQVFGFADWLWIGLPMSAAILPCAWLWLTRAQYRLPDRFAAGAAEAVRDERRALGPMNRGEKIVLCVIALTGAGWVFRRSIDLGWGPLPSLQAHFPLVDTDASVALLAGLSLFALPVDLRKREFVLDMPSAMKIPWDVLLIIGGGVCLARGFAETGLSDWLANTLTVLQGIHPLAVLLICVTLVVFMTELTSNTATSTVIVPLTGALAAGLGQNPLFLMIPCTIAVSMAFMLPAATPPNAVVFGSGHVTGGQMARTGFFLNWMAILLIAAIASLITFPLFDISLHQLPAWAVPQ